MEESASTNIQQNQPADWQADVVPEDGPAFTISAHAWIGPLPDPITMERYDSLVPGAAERFLVLLEDEVTHRQTMDHRESRRRDWGLISAFVVVVLIVAAGAGLIYLGHGWAGAAVIGVNIVGLAAVFITGGFRWRRSSVRAISPDSQIRH